MNVLGSLVPWESPQKWDQTVEIKHNIMGARNVKAEHFNEFALKLVA